MESLSRQHSAKSYSTMDFEFGKLADVARYDRQDRRREYRLLVTMVVATSVPYAWVGYHYPMQTSISMLFLAYLQVLGTFALSANTDTAHAIRFLLSGSNPFGMTGASSLLLGAVDAIVDWQEDRQARRQKPFRFWLLFVYKLAMTPIGVLLMMLEYVWDAVLMRRPSLICLKWNELFSLAFYHDLICPEKSNDIFYADLAFARFQKDPYLYQWNRMRAMVFELQHYKLDVEAGIGAATTNVFWQDLVSAFCTFDRLKIAKIEAELKDHFDTHPSALPFPETISRRLAENAQPIRHYLRFRQELSKETARFSEFDLRLATLLDDETPQIFKMWLVLSLLPSQHLCLDKASVNHIPDHIVDDLATRGILMVSQTELQISAVFAEKIDQLICEFYDAASPEQIEPVMHAQIPHVLNYRGRAYLLKSER